MNLINSISNVLKKIGIEPIDPVEDVIRRSDVAASGKLEAERKAQGPVVAALAAAEVAADSERRAKEAEARFKIARASAKASSKRAKHYRKLASRAASRASAAEVDAAAIAAEAIRVSQSAAVEEVETFLSENQKTR